MGKNKKTKKISIELNEEELIALVLGAAQFSCTYNYHQSLIKEEFNLWEVECCDYNEAINSILKQINVFDIDDEDYREYIELLNKAHVDLKRRGY